MGSSIYVDALSSYQHRNCPRLGCPFFARVDKDYCKLEISVNGNNTATMERVSLIVYTKSEMHDLHVSLINGDQT